MGIESTTHNPLFLQTAEDLLARLSKDGTPGARALADEASQLRAILVAWHAADDGARLATITQLFDLNRRVLDHLSHAAAASKPPASR